MSTATKTAIVAAMEGDAQLVALLARDPDDNTAPAIFNAHFSGITPVYPCITYRIESNNPDARFRPTPAEGGGQSKIEDEYLQMESWSKSLDSAEIEAIDVRLAAIFDGVAISLSAGRVYRSARIMSSTDNYDSTLNASFGLARFRLRVSKG